MRKQKKKQQTIILAEGEIISAFIMVPVPSYNNVSYVNCQNCGLQVPSNYNYCYNCGKPLHQPIVLKICPKCKTRISAAAKYCPECGTKQKLENHK